MHSLKATLSPVMGLLLTGCLLGDIFGSGRRGELDEHRRTWQESSVTDYSYRLERSCFCINFGPADVSVVDGEIVSVFRLFDSTSVALSEFDIYETFDDLFARVDAALRDEAHSVSVIYDETYGFPSRIEIDYIKNAVDDEITLSVSQFVPRSGDRIP